MIVLQIELDIEDDEEVIVKVPRKKVVKKAEDTKSKKEHVNVVFIGHVGKLRIIIITIIFKKKDHFFKTKVFKY